MWVMAAAWWGLGTTCNIIVWQKQKYIDEVIDFVEFLTIKSSRLQGSQGQEKPSTRIAGIAKDPDFFMASDFDEPLDDFEDYM